MAKSYYTTADHMLPDFVERIPTGSLILDQLMGGGWAKCRHHEVFGENASGKTTLALMAIRECQKLGGRTAFLDVEHALDRKYAKFLGVDLSKMYYPELTDGSSCLDAMRTYLNDRDPFDLLVFDSLGAVCPDNMYSGSDDQLGTRAKLIDEMFRISTARADIANCAVIWLNQLRDTIGGYGGAKVTPGGNAPKFYCTYRISIGARMMKNSDDKVFGREIVPKIIKNKLGLTEYDPEPIPYIHGVGVDNDRELLTLCYNTGIITMAAGYYAYNGERIGHGKDKAVELLKSNTAFRDKLFKEYSEKTGYVKVSALRPPPPPPAPIHVPFLLASTPTPAPTPITPTFEVPK